MEDPYAAVEWILQHRMERELKVIKTLQLQNSGDLDTLVRDVYSDVDAILHPIAKWSLEAHLIKLINDGVVKRTNNKFIYIGDRPV